MKPLMFLIAPLQLSLRSSLRSTMRSHLVAVMAVSWVAPALAQSAAPMVAPVASVASPAAPSSPAAVPAGVVSGSAGADSPDLWKLRKAHEDRDTELRLDIATARLEKKLNDIRNGKDSDDTSAQTAMPRPGMFGPQAMPAPGAVTAAAPVEKTTSVDDIFTSPKINDNHPSATIRLPSGRTTTVMAGTRVAGLGTITSVTREQVLYRDAAGHEAALPFSSGTEQ